VNSKTPNRDFTCRLDRGSLPMRLWKKALRLGTWNPYQIDLSVDRRHWQALSTDLRRRVLQLCVLFRFGEEAVTRELLPLMHVVAAEGRLEEQLYLTSFLWEEAKHVDFFSRFFEEVAGDSGDLTEYYHPVHECIFEHELPNALQALKADSSPEAQVRAVVTYHFVIEGVLAETGYHVFGRMLSREMILPGLRRALTLLRRDEARHTAFGMYFLGRLITEFGNRAYRAFLDRMGELKQVVENSTRQFMSLCGSNGAFGVSDEEMVQYSQRRFANRIKQILTIRTERYWAEHPAEPEHRT
jgi:ribonucleoside-diphosphate reductase beta chain